MIFYDNTSLRVHYHKSQRTCLRSDISKGINIINSSAFYKHAEIFCHFPEIRVPVNREILVEFSGLKIPMGYDCPNIVPHEELPFSMLYCAADVWTRCYLLEGLLKTGMEFYSPQLPIMAEEYGEYVELLQTLWKDGNEFGTFVMVEAGARWGTWGFRAAKAAEVFFGKEFNTSLLFFEVDENSCNAIHTVAKMNQFTDYKVECNPFSQKRFLGLKMHFSSLRPSKV